MDVLGFAKFLLQSQPDGNAARLSLYHFLKHHFVGTEPLTPKVLDQYFARVLEFSTVRENRAEFVEEVLQQLHAYLKTQNQVWKRESMKENLQVVEIQNLEDLYEIVRAWSERQFDDADKVRILPNNEDGVVLVRLMPNGELSVYDFDRHCAIRDGIIEPLHVDSCVHYNQDLEPKQGVLQSIRVQPGAYGRFVVGPQSVEGVVLRGYTFNKVDDVRGSSISQIPLIFYPMKRLERFFINRASDPLYIELTRLLDQAVLLCKEGHPEAIGLASAAFERGQNALQYIFTDDKILALLLRELSQQLFQHSNLMIDENRA